MSDQTPTPPPDDHENDDARFAPPDDTGLPDLPPPDDDDTPLAVDADELDALADQLDALGLGNIATPPDETIQLEATVSLPAVDGPPTPEDDPAPTTDWPPAPGPVDVESALGAVSGLDAMVEMQEAEDRMVEQEAARLEDILANPLPLPTRLEMRRGGLQAILPGVALVGLGAWLTFAYTTGSAPALATVGAVLIGLFAGMLLLAWVGSGRWGRGTLFIALWGILSAGAVVLIEQVLGAGLVAALVIALGAAFLLSGLFARPLRGNIMLVGLMFGIGGAMALLMALDRMPPLVLDLTERGWIGVAVVAGLVLALPLLRRVRG